MTPNPYDSPNSDLTSEPIQPRKPPGIWWRLYFFTAIPLMLLSYVFTFATSERNERAKNVIDLILYLIVVIGAGGYIFSRKILRPEFWRYFFYFYIVYAIIFFAVWAFENANTMQRNEFIVSILAMIIILPVTIPSYIALYRYGSPNERPWYNEST